jgi:hypothetical protein
MTEKFAAYVLQVTLAFPSTTIAQIPYRALPYYVNNTSIIIPRMVLTKFSYRYESW